MKNRRLLVLFTVIAAITLVLWSVSNSAMHVHLAREAHAASRASVKAAIKFDRWQSLPDLPLDVAIYESVFWEPDDTASLRQLIRDTNLVADRRVLEIGTGSGLVSLYCLLSGARQVVATDVNAAALANARYNVERFRAAERFETRLVPTDDAGAFAVIGDAEVFDLIISNPPWEDGQPASIDQYALYDPGFELLNSLLAQAKQHLSPGGKLLLVYGCVEAVEKTLELAARHGFEARIVDERQLEDLDSVFLPGMLIELGPAETPPAETAPADRAQDANELP